MLKAITELAGAKLVGLDNSQTLGEVVNWVINPDRKQISAFLIRPPGLLARNLAVSTIDIVEYGPRMIVVKNQTALVSPAEIVHLPKLIRSRYRVIGSPVVTQSGKKLGVVEEVLFETNDASIQKIYIRPGILSITHQPDLIIGADKIVAIESRRIVVQDGIGQWQAIKKTAPAPTTN